MEVKNPIRKRLNKGFSLITIVCCIALVLCDIAIFAMSSQYEHAMSSYGFSQGDIGKAMVTFSEARSSLRAVISYKSTTEKRRNIRQKSSFLIPILVRWKKAW